MCTKFISREIESGNKIIICIKYIVVLFKHKLELIDAGSETFPNDTYGWINVKDVANAHIQAYEIASASGRYCLVERVAHYSELAKILHDQYPTYKVPEK